MKKKKERKKPPVSWSSPTLIITGVIKKKSLHFMETTKQHPIV